MIRIALLCCLFFSPAQAGPWMRAQGTQFLSISSESEIGNDGSPFSSLYYEYGAGSRLTLGIDAGANTTGYSKSFLFLRTPLQQSENGARMALEFALGQLNDNSGGHPAIRGGISWGKGLNINHGGWISLSATLDYLPYSNRTDVKFEGTLGLNRGKRSKLLMQITAERIAGQDVTASFTPGLAWKMNNATHLVGGIVLKSDQSPALKLGIWLEI